MGPSQLDPDDARAVAVKEAVRVARAVLSSELGVIEGCRMLSDLSHLIVADWVEDDDFVVFGAVDSETDHLPIGSGRQFWEPRALAAKDDEVAAMERSVRTDVDRACRSVIARFGVE